MIFDLRIHHEILDGDHHYISLSCLLIVISKKTLLLVSSQLQFLIIIFFNYSKCFKHIQTVVGKHHFYFTFYILYLWINKCVFFSTPGLVLNE